MPIAKSHSDSDPRKRKPKAGVMPDGKIASNTKSYERMEAIINECYTDCVNGEARSNIIRKLELGLYSAQDGKCYAKRTAQGIYAAVKERMINDMSLRREEAQALILSRLESIYQDGVTAGDRSNSIGALNSMAKIFGIDKPNQQQTVQISSDNKCVTINFGFSNDNNESIEEEQGAS